MKSVKPMVNLTSKVCRKHCLTAEHFRWYDISQCPWPALCVYKLPENYYRPVWKKVFKLLRQKTDDYVERIVRIRFLSLRNFPKTLFVVEWIGIWAWPCRRMAHGGEDTGDYFMNISIVSQWPNTNLFRDERSNPFYIDSLSHQTTSYTTFNSKNHHD